MGAYGIVIFVIDNQVINTCSSFVFLMVKFLQENECLQSEETC